MPNLPPVPVIRVPSGQDAAVVLLEQAPDSAHRILEGARRRYTRTALAILDSPSRRWMLRNASPYRDTMLQAERMLRQTGRATGFWGLNTSYEWACTAGVMAIGTPRHLRVLDWDTPGLGQELHATVCGDVVLLTWPGFGGCVTGMRRGSFSLALNQPPLPGPVTRPNPGPVLHLASQALGWASTRLPRWSSRALPPSHLVRLVLEQCRTAADALAMLRGTPVCAGALLSMAGTAPGEAWLIEKDVGRCIVHHAPTVSCASHHGPTPPDQLGTEQDEEQPDHGILAHPAWIDRMQKDFTFPTFLSSNLTFALLPGPPPRGWYQPDARHADDSFVGRQGPASPGARHSPGNGAGWVSLQCRAMSSRRVIHTSRYPAT